MPSHSVIPGIRPIVPATSLQHHCRNCSLHAPVGYSRQAGSYNNSPGDDRRSMVSEACPVKQHMFSVDRQRERESVCKSERRWHWQDIMSEIRWLMHGVRPITDGRSPWRPYRLAGISPRHLSIGPREVEWYLAGFLRSCSGKRNKAMLLPFPLSRFRLVV